MFPITLPESAKKSYIDLAATIRSGASLETISSQCLSSSTSPDEQNNAFIYAAIIDANCNPLDAKHLERARELLSHAEGHPFAYFLARYLAEKGVFAPTASAFQSRVPYDVWVATAFYKEYRTHTLKAFQQFLAQTPPLKSDSILTICDIGPGNGILLGDILAELFAIYPLPELRVVLLEMSPQMLEATVQHLEERFGEKVKPVKILGRVQDCQAMLKASAGPGYWFVMGSASLHHLPKEGKQEIFQTLARTTQHLVLTDFVANHDLPQLNSPELVYSVSNFYAYIIDDVWKTPTESESRKWQAIADFFLTEAIHMLTKERLERIDYHAPIELWNQVAAAAGYHPLETTYTSFDGERPISFTTVYKRT